MIDTAESSSGAPSRRSLRKLIIPGAMTAVMLTLLIGLGVWQVQRLSWKQGLLADIERAENAPPVPMPLEPMAFGSGIAVDTAAPAGAAMPAPFTKVAVSGRFRPDLSALYGAEVRATPDGTTMGAQLLMPLERPGGAVLLVDRGWVPLSRRQPIGTPEGEVTVQGYVRPPDTPGAFSPRDDAATRQFYTLDPKAIGAALGLASVEPFTLVVLGPQPPDLFPDPARHLPRPPNDHLSYAITWFGLALALAVIFAIWSAKVLRP